MIVTVILKWLRCHATVVTLFAILILAAFLRFYRYDLRWGLAADQARDALVTRVALRLHTLPLIGPFSASGPYVFGPFWYWILMIPIGLFPHSVLAPWIFLTLLYIFMVYLMFCIGKNLVDSRFGILLAFLTAVSPAEIMLSTNLIMSAFVGFLSVCVYFFFIRYLKEKRTSDVVIMSFLIGLSINIHFEAIPLTLLLVLAFTFGERKITHILPSIVLFLLPFIPLAIFNARTNSYELYGIFHPHVSTIQPTVWTKVWSIGLQEINFFRTIVPRAWTRVIGGYLPIMIGNIILALLFIIAGYVFIFRKVVVKEMRIFLFAGLGMAVIVGCYPGTLFVNFLAFFYPLLLIFTVWIWYRLQKIQPIVGAVFMVIIFCLSLVADGQSISQAVNFDAEAASAFTGALINRYPQAKFSLFNYTMQNLDKGLSLSLFLDVRGKIDSKGEQIGFAVIGSPVHHQILFDGPPDSGLRIYDVRGTSKEALKKEGFVPINPEEVYASVEQWYKNSEAQHYEE